MTRFPALDILGFGSTSGTFHLSNYIQRGATVNCYDQAAAVTMLGRLLGIDVTYSFMSRFGYINTVNLAGVGNTNNPFYSDPSMSDDVIISPADALIGSDDARSGFGNHAFACTVAESMMLVPSPVTDRLSPSTWLIRSIRLHAPLPAMCLERQRIWRNTT